MPRILAMIAVAAGPLLGMPQALCAQAQTGAQHANQVIVNGDRRVCRRFERTNSRMRVGRICRTAAEWRVNGVDIREHSTIEEAANALENGAGRVSTGDTGGCLCRTDDTPLGPR
jgi:hypothetical protein